MEKLVRLCVRLLSRYSEVAGSLRRITRVGLARSCRGMRSSKYASFYEMYNLPLPYTLH